MTLGELREQVLQKAKQSFAEGLFAGTSGNLSARDPAGGLVAITPSAVPYPAMELEDIVVLTTEGRVVEGRHPPSSEWRLHCGIYREREEVGGVVHTHSPYATAFAVVQKPIPVTLVEMLFFLQGEVPVAAYCPPGSEEMAQAALEALRNRTACLLANHGVAAVGETLDQAHLRAVYVEDAAKITALAMGLGEIALIPREEQNRIRRASGMEEE